MTNEDTIMNLIIMRVGFIEHETKEQEEIIDKTIVNAIISLSEQDKIHKESYKRGYNKAMSTIYLAYNKSEYPEYTEDYIYQELNKWEKEGVPNEQ